MITRFAAAAFAALPEKVFLGIVTRDRGEKVDLKESRPESIMPPQK
jgi:hypothetical protein